MAKANSKSNDVQIERALSDEQLELALNEIEIIADTIKELSIDIICQPEGADRYAEAIKSLAAKVGYIAAHCSGQKGDLSHWFIPVSRGKTGETLASEEVPHG